MELPKLPDEAVVVVEVVGLVHQLLLELDRSEHLEQPPVFAYEVDVGHHWLVLVDKCSSLAIVRMHLKLIWEDTL